MKISLLNEKKERMREKCIFAKTTTQPNDSIIEGERQRRYLTQ
jgi:hypothetical protein